MPAYRTHWLAGDEFTADFDKYHARVAIRVLAVLDSGDDGEWCHVAVTDIRRTRFRGRFYLAMLPHTRHGFYARTDDWVPADAEGCALTAWSAGTRVLATFSDEPTLVYAVRVLHPNWPTPPTIIRTFDVRVEYVVGTIVDGAAAKQTLTNRRCLGAHTGEIYCAYHGRDYTTNTDLWKRVK
jgi:hypothetical protein